MRKTGVFVLTTVLSAVLLGCASIQFALSSNIISSTLEWKSILLAQTRRTGNHVSFFAGQKKNGEFETMSTPHKNVNEVPSNNANEGRGKETPVDSIGFRNFYFDSLRQSALNNSTGRKFYPVPEAAGIVGTLSEQGLLYVKDVLVNEILTEVTPVVLPEINARVNSPIGRLDASLTNVLLSGVTVTYSEVDLGQEGITIFAAGVRATIDMHWEYHYSGSYVPFPVRDGGYAKVQVTGMQAGVTVSLAEHNGTLRLVVEECGTYIEDLIIELHGGASWLYQWFVYAFDYQIRAAIEMELTNQIIKGAETLDRFLLALPRAIPIDDTSAIDVTIVQDPLVSPTYLSVGAKGEFISLILPTEYPEPDIRLPAGLFCSQSAKMVTIALSDYVLNSAATVYYSAGYLQWIVDDLPGNYLNTASWKYIVPQLYKKFPNKDMALNFSVSSTPKVQLTKDGIQAVASADMVIDVDDNSSVISVACINLMVSMDAVANLQEGNITAQASLNELTLQLKWSEIGSFPVALVQATVRAIVTKVILPLLNLNLKRGFPLPVLPAVQLQDADLRYEDGYILVCTDIHYTGGLILKLQQQL